MRETCLSRCLFGWVGASVGREDRAGETGNILDASARATGQESTARREEATQMETKCISNFHPFCLWHNSPVCVLEGKWTLQSTKSMCGPYHSKPSLVGT